MLNVQVFNKYLESTQNVPDSILIDKEKNTVLVFKEITFQWGEWDNDEKQTGRKLDEKSKASSSGSNSIKTPQLCEFREIISSSVKWNS